MVHVLFVIFWTLVGQPFNCLKYTESRTPLPRIFAGLNAMTDRTLGIGVFSNLANAGFICCQRFFLLDKWAVPIHALHELICFYRPWSWDVSLPDWGISNSFFSLKYIPSCSLNIEAISPHLWSVLWRRLFFGGENCGIWRCVVRKKNPNNRT